MKDGEFKTCRNLAGRRPRKANGVDEDWKQAVGEAGP